MTRTLTHITTAGDRWDLLAWRYYGDAGAYSGIIAANPHVALTDCLPSGLVLLIPVTEPPHSTEDLPPWLR